VLPPLPEPDGVLLVVGLGVGDAVADGLTDVKAFAAVDRVPELDGFAVEELAELGFAVLEEAAEFDGLAVVEEVAELDGFVAVELAELDGFAVAEEVAELGGFAEVDGVAVGVGAAAKAVAVTPLEITKRPVARPSVTGRVCADGIRTPCLWWLSRLGGMCSSALWSHWVQRVSFDHERSYSTLRGALAATPPAGQFETGSGRPPASVPAIRHWAASSRGYG
jgi:hypothetical protein